MTQKINTEGLDELVAQGVTVVITERVVFLQVTIDNEVGALEADQYVVRCASTSNGDKWMPAEKVTVRRPGGLNVARDWHLFFDYLQGRSSVALYLDSIALNHYIEDREKARNLYEILKDKVKIETHEFKTYDIAGFTREFDKVQSNQTVSVLKEPDGLLRVSVPGDGATGDED